MKAPLLSITRHAYDRFRERTGCTWMTDDDVRNFMVPRVLDAIRADNLLPGPHCTQALVRLCYRGAEVYAVVGWDAMGVSRTRFVVVTVLSVEHVRQEARAS